MATERTVAVLGAGAVGGFLAGKLAFADSPPRVTLIGRSSVMEAVARRGLVVRETISHVERDQVTHPQTAVSSDDLGTFNLVILAVRTHGVSGAIPALQRLAGDHGLVLAMQNGVGTDTLLVDALGPDRVLAGSLTTSVGMDEPGTVVRYSMANGLGLASTNDAAVPNWIMATFASTGVPTVEIADHRSLRWSKLLLNMLGAATSAILDLDLGAIASNPALFRLEQLAFREASRVMRAQGIPAVDLPGYPVQLMLALMRTPRPLAQSLIAPRLVRARKGRSPSTRADMARGRTEINYYNGAVADVAATHGIRAPLNAALATLARELAAHPGRRQAYRENPEALLAYLAARAIRVD